MRRLRLGVYSVLVLAVSAASLFPGGRASAGIGYSGSPQCTGPGENPNVFGRCLTKGYFTGVGTNDSFMYTDPQGQQQQYETGETPLQNTYNYFESWSGVSQWVFPSVSKAGSYNFEGTPYAYGGGSNIHNPTYALLFITQIRAYLNADFSQNGPNHCVSGAYYHPANGTDPPAGYNVNANQHDLNYFLGSALDPNAISTGSTCFNLRRNAVSAAMIITTMFGRQGTDFGSIQSGISYAKANFAAWQALVLNYETRGWVNWNAEIVAEPGHLNTTGMNAGSDDEWFTYPNRSYNANSIVFQNPNNANSVYTINRKCGNLIGATHLTDPGPLDYDLQPHVAAGSSMVAQGQPAAFQFSVENTKPNASPPTAYTTAYTVTPGPAGTLPNGPQGSQVFAAGTTSLGTKNLVTTSYAAGTKICAKLTVGPPAANNYAGSRSAQACTTVVGEPYFSVSGGDVSTGSGMDGPAAGDSCSLTKNTLASIVSWNQEAAGGYAGAGTNYAAFALNRLQDFASGQGSTLVPSRLSFANASSSITLDASTYGGNYGGSDCAKNEFVDRAGTTIYDGAYTLPASYTTISSQTPTVYVKGNVYINHNVIYAGSGNYGSIGALPSFSLVVEGNIFIDNSVTQLDGVYSAQPDGNGNGGRIYDCSPGPNHFASPVVFNANIANNCNNKLTFNGAVIAAQLWLLRTHGSLYGDAAEQFNYTPETWLTSPFTGDTTGKADNYNAITSLPPEL